MSKLIMINSDGTETLLTNGSVIVGVDLSETEDLTASYGEFLTSPTEVEFECETRLDTKSLWLLLTGEKISNNWLKMHGGIMTRKSYDERKGRRKKNG